MQELEVKREGAYSNISTLLDHMKESTSALNKETRGLVSALKTSTSRGRYGEIALRRLVEFSGMLQHCDFVEQQCVDTEGGKLRPDLVVKLPESRQVVIDSKVPLVAYLEIFETEDLSAQKACMDRHVGAIRKHIADLSSKAYWDQFQQAPDFVVMFMQIESSFGAALQACPGLIEEALNNRIIIATPTTLITILRSIAYSWNQMKTIENIDEIRDAAVELYERSATLMEHMENIGSSLKNTVTYYNKAVGSLEVKVSATGKKDRRIIRSVYQKETTTVNRIRVNYKRDYGTASWCYSCASVEGGRGLEAWF
jgi:DNA recombination protein RmuC